MSENKPNFARCSPNFVMKVLGLAGCPSAQRLMGVIENSNNDVQLKEQGNSSRADLCELTIVFWFYRFVGE